MPSVLKVNGRDLSTFLRLQPDEGFEAAGVDYLTPQFGGAPALAEGGVFVADATTNKEWTAPLWLHSPTGAAGVDELVEGVNLDLFTRGPAAVEYRPEGATQSTFFDLERGRLDPHYSHHHHRKGWMKADLKLWTKPYGHTGTMRTVVPSAVSPNGAPVVTDITGLAGDVPALGNMYLAPQSAPVASYGFFMYGLSALPGFDPVISASAMQSSISGQATTQGNSQALASQMFMLRAQPSMNGSAMISFQLSPSAFAGRHRMFAMLGHAFANGVSGGGSGVRVWLETGFVIGGHAVATNVPTALITLTSPSRFQMVDLGQVTVPSQVPGAQPQPDYRFSMLFAHAYPTYSSTYPIRCGGIVLLPLDHSAAMAVYPDTNALSGMKALSLRSWPEREAYGTIDLGGSGMGPIMAADTDLQPYVRGETPRMPKGATQARLMMWSGRFDNTTGAVNMATPFAYQFDVLERFRFLR